MTMTDRMLICCRTDTTSDICQSNLQIGIMVRKVWFIVCIITEAQGLDLVQTTLLTLLSQGARSKDARHPSSQSCPDRSCLAMLTITIYTVGRQSA